VSVRPCSFLALVVAVAACDGQRQASASTADSAAAAVAVVDEAYVTPLDTIDNVDGPAVYHGPGGTHWLIATAKSANVLIVYDATSGSQVRRVGGRGNGAGQLSRPNGILVLGDSLLLVVERDNARVQGFRLPGFEPAGTFGERLLRLPYGITAYPDSTGAYTVYVTDNYETLDEQVPADNELGERVKQFRVQLNRGRLAAEHVRSFGDTTGDGIIRVAESIAVDAPNNRLLVAEELETDSHIKVYDTAGRFTGRTLGRGRFPQQAEGIAMYACGDTGGYWIATDQGDSTNTFVVFDRMSFEYTGSFTGAITRRTDGIALTQRPFGPFPAGALFGSHIDAGVGALSWARIAKELRLRTC
jgi:3-phytase